MKGLILLLLAAAYVSTAEEVKVWGNTCEGIKPYKDGSVLSLAWLRGRKYVNILMSSKIAFDGVSEILTGAPAKEGSEKTACLQVTWKMDLPAKKFEFALHGFKACASYQCDFGHNKTGASGTEVKKMCKPTHHSTNLEWANKLQAGKPITILTDEKTYAVDVRCPQGKPRHWFVKSINKTLDPIAKENIIKAVKEANLPCENPIVIPHENCEPPQEIY